MNRKITAILFILCFSAAIWRLSQQRNSTVSKPTHSTKDSIPMKRRLRTGPKKPPTAEFRSKKIIPKQVLKDTTPQKSDEDARKKELEEKLQLYFDRLASINSPTPEQLIALGELAFDANDAESAYEHFLEIIEENPDDKMAPFALYKFAWVEFNLGDVDAAILDMELVTEWIEMGDVKQEGILIRAAPEDLIFFKKSKTSSD